MHCLARRRRQEDGMGRPKHAVAKPARGGAVRAAAKPNRMGSVTEKLQAPTSNIQRNFKFQSPTAVAGPSPDSRRMVVGAWCLEFFWSFVLGIWCLQAHATFAAEPTSPPSGFI